MKSKKSPQEILIKKLKDRPDLKDLILWMWIDWFGSEMPLGQK